MENALFAQKNQMRAQKVTKSNSCMKLMEKGITKLSFQGTIEKVLRQTIEFQTKDELIVQVVEKLPIRFTAAISNNNFVNVSI